MRGEYFRRTMLIVFGFIFVGAAIIFQMIRLQYSPEAEDLRLMARIYAWTDYTFHPARGQIYDRWGRLLAGNETSYEIGANLIEVESPDTIAFVLDKVLADYERYQQPIYPQLFYDLASTEPSTQSVYVVLADYIAPADVAEIQQWAQQYEELYKNRNDPNRPTLDGLVFKPHPKRSYPEKTLASALLGFVNWDGEGNFGVEEMYNPQLAGKAETVRIPVDPNLVKELPDIPNGADLILTIDRDIQAMAETALDEALAETGAEAGTIIIMDPRNGEILAMASTPRMDLNQYTRYAEVYPGRTPFNRAISMDFEPGSTFKVITMAAALDAGVVTTTTEFLDTGSFEWGGYSIHNWNWGAWGWQSMQGCLQHSLNVCLAWVSTTMGAEKFYSYAQAFGIGHLTGIDMANEVSGRIKIPGDTDWYDIELAVNAYGQGVSVTPIQLVTAVSAVANGGRMMAPHVVKAFIDRGDQFDIQPRQIGQPIRTETAQLLSQMLAASLEEEASNALVPGYRLAGKTGTADIPTPAGDYSSGQTNASFIGWGPVDDPRFVVYVLLEKPTTDIYGSVVAAPVFQEVVERLVVLLKLPPDDIRLQMHNGQ